MRRTIIWLFVIALSIRAIIALLQMKYGINSSLNIDQYLYGQFNPGFELYHDFQGYYVKQLVDLRSGLFPYKDFAYSYPPLFLYTLYPFYVIAGSAGASIPIWLSDAVTTPLIYLVSQHFVNPKISTIMGLSYALSPIFLIYEGYVWYSSQPMIFFMVLSFYLLLTRRPFWSSLAFAACVMYKQEMIALLPVFVVWYFRGYAKNTLIKSMIAFGSIIVMISLPFVLISPAQYVTSLSYGILEHSYPPALYASSTSTVGQLANGASSQLHLSCNTISNTWRSLICNYGSFTYTDAKLIAPWSVMFSAAFMNQISMWLFFPILVVTVYNLIRLRKDRSSLMLSGSVMVTALLAVFALQVHSIYRYYLLPAYVFPLVTARARISAIVAISVPLISLMFPSGNCQLLFPLTDVLMVLLLNHAGDKIPFENPNFLSSLPKF